MALDFNRIVTAAKNGLVNDPDNVRSDPDDITPQDSRELEAFVHYIAKEVVDEFTTNAEVNTTVTATEDSTTPVQVDPNSGTGATTTEQSSSGTGTGGIS